MIWLHQLQIALRKNSSKWSHVPRHGLMEQELVTMALWARQMSVRWQLSSWANKMIRSQRRQLCETQLIRGRSHQMWPWLRILLSWQNSRLATMPFLGCPRAAFKSQRLKLSTFWTGARLDSQTSLISTSLWASVRPCIQHIFIIKLCKKTRSKWPWWICENHQHSQWTKTVWSQKR